MPVHWAGEAGLRLARSLLLQAQSEVHSGGLIRGREMSQPPREDFNWPLKMSIKLERWIDSEGRYQPWVSLEGQTNPEQFERQVRYFIRLVRPTTTRERHSRRKPK